MNEQDQITKVKNQRDASIAAVVLLAILIPWAAYTSRHEFLPHGPKNVWLFICLWWLTDIPIIAVIIWNTREKLRRLAPSTNEPRAALDRTSSVTLNQTSAAQHSSFKSLLAVTVIGGTISSVIAGLILFALIGR